MIIIKMKGGLGNQLFQYALYKNFLIRGIDAKIDLSLYDELKENRKYELENLGIYVNKATKQEIRRLFGDNTSFLNKLGRRTIGKNRYFKEEIGNYYPKIHEFANKYLNGYWQDERYFLAAAEEIRNEIQFSVEEWMIDDQLKKIIDNCNTTSIHVRLGDYVGHAELDGICTESYYQAAIRYINSHVGNTEYIVFSDDINVAAEMFHGKHFYFVKHKNGIPDYLDMYLMTQCNQNIIANSTFSWWGAWLNQTREKIVVAPEKWFNRGQSHIVPQQWIRLSGEVF